jgi:hypothetical protein
MVPQGQSKMCHHPSYRKMYMKNFRQIATYVPAQLKTPKNKRLCTPNEILSAKRTRFSSKLTNEKIAFVQLQKEKFLEEHALKIDILHLKKKLLLKQLSE